MFKFLKRLARRRPDPALLALEQAQTAFLAAIESITRSQAEAIQSMHLMASHQADAARAQADAFNTFLQSFRVTEAPNSRVMRDQDEWRAEMSRKGFPVDGTPEQQLQWVMKNSDGALDVDDLMRAAF